MNTIALHIGPAQAEIALRVFRSRLEEIENETESLEEKLDRLNKEKSELLDTIDQLDPSEKKAHYLHHIVDAESVTSSDSSNIIITNSSTTDLNQYHIEYDKNDDWVNRIMYVLSEAGMVLKTSEIGERLIEIHPELRDKSCLKTVSSMVNPELNDMFRRTKPNGKGRYLIGLRHWFDKNGDIKPFYTRKLNVETV